MGEATSVGVEQARISLGDLVLKAERSADLKDAITIISRYGRDVAAVVPAAVAKDALDDDAEPHPAAIYRIALSIHHWRQGHRDVAVHELPDRELGRALGYAEALHAAVQRESGSDVYLARHPTQPAAGDLAWVTEMLDFADRIVADWTAWIRSISEGT